MNIFPKFIPPSKKETRFLIFYSCFVIFGFIIITYNIDITLFDSLLFVGCFLIGAWFNAFGIHIGEIVDGHFRFNIDNMVFIFCSALLWVLLLNFIFYIVENFSTLSQFMVIA